MIEELAFWSAVVEKEGITNARIFLFQLKEDGKITSENYKAVLIYLKVMKYLTDIEIEDADFFLSILTGYIQKPKKVNKHLEKFLKLREKELANYHEIEFEISKN